MSENKGTASAGDFETQQAVLRQTIELNDELIAQTDRIIASSRRPTPTAEPKPVQN